MDMQSHDGDGLSAPPASPRSEAMAPPAAAPGLSEHVSQEMQRYAAHLDAHLSEHVSQEMQRYAAYLDSHLSERITQEMQRHAAHLDAHLAERVSHLAAALSERVGHDVHRTMAHLDSHLSDHLARELSLQLRAEPLHTGASQPGVLQGRLISLGRLLRPMAARGVAKRRVGHPGDGGYVMLDDLGRAAAALSFGVGQEMTWDLALAQRAIPVHQFDHTIEHPPARHEAITFHRRQIVPVADGRGESLASALDLAGAAPCIIKMDIEGDEWPVLDAATKDDLGRILQFACEFHDFHHATDPAWHARALAVLEKLAAVFGVVHLHANNNGLLRCDGNVPFPEIIEVTFANRRFYDLEDSDDVFPTGLDAPNRPDLPDIHLGAFRF